MTVRELASGIDALYLSGRVELDDSFLADLDGAREEARASAEDVSYRLGRAEFGLAPYGWGRYPYRLSHEFGLVGITGSEHLPAVRVQPRADLLHGLGPEEAVAAFSDLPARYGEIEWSASRVDLFADLQGWIPSVAERDRFVTRARLRTTFEESESLTGLQFGRRAGGGVSARIYDKSRDAAKKGADWWADVWGDAFDPEEPVTRVEFEFGRTAIRECGLDSPGDVFANLPGLWGYATEWLSYRDRGCDQTRSRWPIAREWECVRGVSLRSQPVTIDRVTRSREAASEKRLVAATCGYLSSFAAIRNIEDLSASLREIEPVLRQFELETGIPFTERVKRKRDRYRWGL